jgi:hypothetical protein
MQMLHGKNRTQHQEGRRNSCSLNLLTRDLLDLAYHRSIPLGSQSKLIQNQAMLNIFAKFTPNPSRPGNPEHCCRNEAVHPQRAISMGKVRPSISADAWTSSSPGSLAGMAFLVLVSFLFGDKAQALSSRAESLMAGHCTSGFNGGHVLNKSGKQAICT